ncbi:MAG: endonuclease V [Calditrichaeota bacterium]|nr:MAG: endonuclease V [Calditrichota bacterium]
MDVKFSHIWNVSVEEALQLQTTLSRLVDIQTPLHLDNIHLIAAIDVAYNRENTEMFGAVVLMQFPELKLLSNFVTRAPIVRPYLPGLLSFREIPAILPVLEKLSEPIDLFMCDAHGVAHPRGLGLASHLGVLFDKPSIGCAKKPLVGDFIMPGERKGSTSPIKLNDNLVGYVLRSRENVKPIYISPGHKLTPEDALRVVERCIRSYRIPEPLRVAHQMANRARRVMEGKVSGIRIETFEE